MVFKDKLPVSYLLITNRGRISRSTYWTVSVFIWTTFYVLYSALALISNSATWVIYPLLFGTLITTATKRLHDDVTRVALAVPARNLSELILQLDSAKIEIEHIFDF